MKEYTVFCGAITIVLSIAFKFYSYYEGLNFEASLFVPMLLVIPMVIAIFGFLFSALAILVSILRKKTDVKWVGLPILIGALFIGASYLPLPDYVDGMAESVIEKVEESRLVALANDVIAQKINWQSDSKEYEKKRVALLLNYPELKKLHEFKPNISLTGETVKVYYGGGITGRHWGLVVTDIVEGSSFKEMLKVDTIKKVYGNVWVYEKHY